MKSASEIDAAIVELESEMAHLRVRNPGLYEFANAWAQRYDAILAAAPQDLRAASEQRLQRIGIRWGVAHGVRMTGQFPALEA
ncbi:MAG: hypothetical protein LC715_02325 [Gammaproteobacteria bacterium]|nr:hypothetical protein [Gammaproteobacteria bacterium]